MDQHHCKIHAAMALRINNLQAFQQRSMLNLQHHAAIKHTIIFGDCHDIQVLKWFVQISFTALWTQSFGKIIPSFDFILAVGLPYMPPQEPTQTYTCLGYAGNSGARKHFPFLFTIWRSYTRHKSKLGMSFFDGRILHLIASWQVREQSQSCC